MAIEEVLPEGKAEKQPVPGVNATQGRDRAFKELVVLRGDLKDNDDRMSELSSQESTFQANKVSDLVRAEAELIYRQMLREKMSQEYMEKMKKYVSDYGRLSYSNLNL